MDKVLIKLYVPVIEENYNIWLPINKKIHDIIKLLIKAINENTGEIYKPEQEPMLYDRITGREYDINLKVIETDIRNGSEIILI